MDAVSDDLPTTLARSAADGFDIALRLRQTTSGPVHELIVNGMFAMDSTDCSSEIALADLAPVDADRVLVGGLGLGFTAERVLQRCTDALVDVVDLSGALISWARQGRTPTLAAVAASDRVRLTQADMVDVLTGAGCDGLVGRAWDAILLDVDNGPGFLIHDHNARLYGTDLLAAAIERLRPGGVLAVWSERESTELGARLRSLDPDADVLLVPVERDGRHIDYAIHRARNLTSS